MVTQVLFKKANVIIGRGEKIAIIGPNGCGKSTLLKLIMGLQKPDSGEVILGEHNVLPNYFEQNQVMQIAIAERSCVCIIVYMLFLFSFLFEQQFVFCKPSQSIGCGAPLNHQDDVPLGVTTIFRSNNND